MPGLPLAKGDTAACGAEKPEKIVLRGDDLPGIIYNQAGQRPDIMPAEAPLSAAGPVGADASSGLSAILWRAVSSFSNRLRSAGQPARKTIIITTSPQTVNPFTFVVNTADYPSNNPRCCH